MALALFLARVPEPPLPRLWPGVTRLCVAPTCRWECPITRNTSPFLRSGLEFYYFPGSMEPVTAWSPDRVCEWLKGNKPQAFRDFKAPSSRQTRKSERSLYSGGGGMRKRSSLGRQAPGQSALLPPGTVQPRSSRVSGGWQH